MESGIRNPESGIRNPETETESLDCEQSFFSFRFSESNARARERRSHETRETKAPLPSRAISHARDHLRVSRFARRTTEKERLLVVYGITESETETEYGIKYQ